MKSNMQLSVSAFLLTLLILPIALYAVTPPAHIPLNSLPIEKVWIIAIGVNSYSRKDFFALQEAEKCANEVAQSLYNAQPDITEEPWVLTSNHPDVFKRPTRGFVRAKFAELEKLVEPLDRVIVYFGGHGMEVAGISYLLLMDVTDYRNPELLKDGSISVEEIRNWLNRLNCRESILLLDACRVDSLIKAGDADINNTSKPYSAVTSNMLRTQDSKTVTLFGCQPNGRVYYNDRGLSIFAEALVEGLKGEGKSVDDKGQITMASLGAYVQNRVSELAKSMQLEQKPAMYPAVLSANSWVLRPSPPVIACPLFIVKENNELAAKYNSLFTDNFFTYLVTSKTISMVARKNLDQVMSELKLQSSGLTNPANAIKLGKLLNAVYLIIGTVQEAPGNSLSINVHLVNTQSGEVVGGCAASCEIDPNVRFIWEQELFAMADKLLAAMQEKGLATRKWNDPGTLLIETTPPGARVIIDGKLQDNPTPITLKNLQPGAKLSVSITHDGYEEFTDILTIGSGKPLRIPLMQMLGGITVKSTPPGAKIIINGEERGVTNADGITLDKLPVGTYQVVLRLSDYLDETKQVAVTNKTNSSIQVNLQGLPGEIAVTTTPNGASVYLNDIVKGQTPLTVSKLSSGIYSVRVVLKGYTTQERKLTLAPNRQEKLAIIMEQAKYAQITITSEPNGAVVFVKGKERGVTPMVLTCEEIGDDEVNVQVEVMLNEYQSSIKALPLKIGDQKFLDFTLTKGPLLPTATINPKDQAELLLIKDGNFIMGSNEQTDEKPVHSVFLDQYLIYKYEVSVKQYRQFCEATARTMPAAPKWGWNDNDPIVNVTWDDAQAYAVWAGALLPTEAQWEKAARGELNQKYPWGDKWDNTTCNSKEYGLMKPTAVDSFLNGKSPFGVNNMLGNVAEWCADYYQSQYYSTKENLNPQGAKTGDKRVVRGGSWSSTPQILRCSARGSYYPFGKLDYLGFRCIIIPAR